MKTVDVRLLTISRIWWKTFVSKSEVRRKVLNLSEGTANTIRLRWLGHVLRIQDNCLVARYSPKQIMVEGWFSP